MFRCNKLLKIYGLFVLWCALAVMAVPLKTREIDAELLGDQYEGDMILTEEQLWGIKGITAANIQGRNGLISETKRWPHNIVFYKMVGDFDLIHRQAILDGIATLEARTCLHFQEATETQPNYVAITSEPGGCYTAVGYQAKVQQMNLQIYPLNEGCFRSGTILHEFMHALGFYHQQSDAYRDDYIEILYENIIPGKEFNFEKYKNSFVTDFDVGYDYESCLHYRANAFSVNGKATIRALNNPNAEMGQREGLSKKDIEKINIMYKCPILI